MQTTEKAMPLKGVRVIELGGLIAGPYAASLFAQFGADVIKVEAPADGDPLRRWRKLHNGTSLWWYSLSRNKKSITLNLKSGKGRRILRSLVETADVVIENFRPGVLEGWSLGWEDLSKINPGLVLVRISGYGQDGPYRDKPGFAAIAEAVGGLRYLMGYPDRAPVRAGVSLGDTLAALYAVIGALIALHHRNVNGGTGQVVDAALYEAVFGVMESLIPEYSRSGFVRERTGASLPGIAPSNTYTCGNGSYVVIGGNSDGIKAPDACHRQAGSRVGPRPYLQRRQSREGRRHRRRDFRLDLPPFAAGRSVDARARGRPGRKDLYCRGYTRGPAFSPSGDDPIRRPARRSGRGCAGHRAAPDGDARTNVLDRSGARGPR